MQLVQVNPNPNGAVKDLFLLAWDGAEPKAEGIVNPEILPDHVGSGRLQIFHFNDLHNHLTEMSGPTKGTHRFAQMVQLVQIARRNCTKGETVLFLSAGDDHTGSVLDELLGWKPDQFELDASYRAYSAGGVDFSTLGNHEFDRGSEILATGIDQDADFPLLSANVHSSRHLKSGQHFHPGAIAVCKGLRVGLIGLTTHIETRVGQPDDPTLSLASPVKTVTDILPGLAPLVDVVLILSHCGFGDGNHQSGKAAVKRDIGEADFSIARAAAKLTDKPVLVLGAHTHTMLNETGLDDQNVFDGVPVFQAECNGRYLGQIEIELGEGADRNNTAIHTRLHTIKPLNVDIGPDHPDADKFEQQSDYDHRFEAQIIAPMAGKVNGILTQPIADVVTHQLSFRSAVLTRYTGECALLNYMADAVQTRLIESGHEPDFTLINAATIQAGIEPGSLSLGCWFDVMPYADEIFIVDIPGSQIECILDNNAKRILRPEEISKTDVTGFVGRGFLHNSLQLRYGIETGGSAGSARAVTVKVNNRPISELRDEIFRIAMPTYLALGAFGERWNGRRISGGVPGEQTGFDMRQFPKQNTNLVFRDEIATFIRNSGTIDPIDASFSDGRLWVQSQTKGAIPA